MIRYKPLQPEDAAAFWRFLTALDRETAFMMYEPGEREQSSSPEACRASIEAAGIHGDLLLAAVAGDEIVGFLSAERGAFRRIAHTAYVVIGVREAFRGQGIGAELLRQLDSWAARYGVSRLELTVECRNEPALCLYRRCGFEIEGLRRRSMRVDGAFVDEYYMAKLP